MIVIYRCRAGVAEFLLLHRRHHGPDHEGDWAWAPPSGARYPGEAIERCAARELEEETQLCLALQPATGGTVEWPAFIAEVPAETAVSLSPEHDRFVWLTLEEAAGLIAPAVVRESFLVVAGMLARCE
jgi:8-oxo-dGTP pyrophosphatase MutT (NUDIX family)